MSHDLLIMFGAGGATVIVALIAYFGGRQKNGEERRNLYVTGSDVVIENLREEVERLGAKVDRMERLLTSFEHERMLLHAYIVDLGGDPHSLPAVRFDPRGP